MRATCRRCHLNTVSVTRWMSAQTSLASGACSTACWGVPLFSMRAAGSPGTAGAGPVPLQEQVTPDVELPPELMDLVGALLLENPADRPSSTRVVRHVLRKVALGIPLAASNSLLGRPGPAFDRNRPRIYRRWCRLIWGARGRSGCRRARSSRSRRLAGLPVRRVVPAAAAAVVLACSALYFQFAPAVEKRSLSRRRSCAWPLTPTYPARSPLWLVEEVSQVLRERLGPVRVAGPVGATPVTTLYADPARREGEPPIEAAPVGLALRRDVVRVRGVAQLAGAAGEPAGRAVPRYVRAAVARYRARDHAPALPLTAYTGASDRAGIICDRK